MNDVRILSAPDVAVLFIDAARQGEMSFVGQRRGLSSGNNRWLICILFGNIPKSFNIRRIVVPLTFKCCERGCYDTVGSSSTMSCTAAMTALERLGRGRLCGPRFATEPCSKYLSAKWRIVRRKAIFFLRTFVDTQDKQSHHFDTFFWC